ncbi:hypothetical protein CC2G_015185 [Coprinopsis cinerea AmutBmut pab1-1]|nr:hypothetical protein CC2G_015185 [Coprinopsis cinerea AmutBmut pab1-1]
MSQFFAAKAVTLTNARIFRGRHQKRLIPDYDLDRRSRWLSIQRHHHPANALDIRLDELWADWQIETTVNSEFTLR